ncbi:MAG TPA: hypothetical protein VN786_04355 [Acidimicrobiales bacterium]|nr:hypothetical protein [Acidimicrobiales bacterium]
MAKTGGGKGTNQYRVRGRSVERPVLAQPQHELQQLAGQARALGTREMDRAAIEQNLTDLAVRLDEAGVEARILLVGGAAMVFYYDRQLTVDIDAAVHPTEVLAHAKAMAADKGLRPNWLNNAAAGFLPHEDVPGAPVIEHGGVRVEVAEPGVLLAMKLRACRPRKDSFDIAFLLRRCDVRSFAEALDWLDRYFPEEEIPVQGEAMVHWALGAVTLPTDPPTHLEAVEPRPAPLSCGSWALKQDGRCVLAPGHDGPCSTGAGAAH